MEMQPVSSSNIEGIGYDGASRVLSVQFKGGKTYRYAGVPMDIWDDFINSVSKGAYFAAYIKGQYQTEKV